MVDYLSTTFLAATVLPLVLGFVVGMIVKRVLKLGIAIAALVIILIVLGIISPSQVLGPLVALYHSAGEVKSAAENLAGYLPYSSVTFLIGLAIGFLKG